MNICEYLTADFHQLTVEGKIYRIELYVARDNVLLGEAPIFFVKIASKKTEWVEVAKIRFVFTNQKMPQQKLHKQWLPSIRWYYLNGQNKGRKYKSESESLILEVVDKYLFEYPDVDYRYHLSKEVQNNVASKLYEKVPSEIYLILDESHKVVKIGQSGCPRIRYNQINSDTASPIKMLATIQSDYAKMLDSMLKNHFKPKKYKNEWFKLSPLDIEMIVSRRLPPPICILMGEVKTKFTF
ncbi:GIY-YIG nuclease family protein [Paenibacillus etheri]|uniref:GIY-YIG domain-containing protein n=1 Tax=Paenibacillus etheri TaxID=1306852 RepID=A0A0W1AQN7_9BACL|nr:GIY-YIG nuclease family protein [Paenibacillus etheri]KTD83582.1 hypothetical protein UQ64_01695 [Paenibacillus etheri]